jgi:hypothetical protein
MKLKSSAFFAFLIFPFLLFAQPWKDLSQKDAFKSGFPQFFSFRGENPSKSKKDYDSWKTQFEHSDGLIRKFVNDELEIFPESQKWANRFAKENPSKLILLHLNGEARHVLRYPDLLKKYFPGHWLYQEGTMLRHSISEKDTELEVENIEPFVNRKYLGGRMMGNIKKTNTPVPNHILLVRLDNKGERLWYESEIAQIKKIDEESHKIVIERGLCNTKKLSYDSNHAYVAPIEEGMWGGGMMFFYNFSLDCPKDKNGKTASDVFVEEIAQWFSPKGELSNLQGICFDVNYFDISDRLPLVDVNNDGKSDGGWINNQNHWKLGDYDFLKKLRARMGENFIITSDGEHAENQQAVGVLNGIESEGLVQHNDGWRGFSRTVNLHQYWEHNNTMMPDFRYVVLKLMNSADANNTERLQRFGIGTACCLKAFTTEPDTKLVNKKYLNEDSERNMLPVWMRKSGALGSAKNELVHLAKQSKNILDIPMSEIMKFIKTDNCKIHLVNNQLEIFGDTDLSISRDMTITFKGLNLPSGDITIFVDACAVEPSEGLSVDDRVPRIMWAKMNNLPDYGEGKNVNTFYNNLTGLFGTSQFSEMSFYYRRPDNIGSQKCDFELKIQGKGRIIIRSIKIYNESDILIREFEKGLVIVNPSFNRKEIDLTSFGDNKKIFVPAIDAVFVKR